MYKYFSKPGKSKEGQKFISSLSEFDQLLTSPKQQTSSNIPNLDYFPTTITTTTTTDSRKQSHIRSPRLSELQNDDDKIKEQTKRLSYFKSKIRISLENLPSHSSLVTSSSLSNRNMQQTKNNPSNSSSKQQRIDMLNVKQYTSTQPQDIITYNNNFIENQPTDADDNENDDNLEQDKQMNEELSENIRDRFSPSLSSYLPVQFESSEQVMTKYLGNVSKKQLQISNLIDMKQKQQSQLKRRSKQLEETEQYTLGQRECATERSNLTASSHYYISHSKKKSNSDIVPVKKHNSLNIIQNQRRDERTSSVTENSVNTLHQFQLEKQPQTHKKSIFVHQLPSTQQYQYYNHQSAKSRNLTPTAAQDIEYKSKNLQHQHSSHSSTRSLTRQSLTPQIQNFSTSSFQNNVPLNNPLTSIRKGSLNSLLIPSNYYSNTINHNNNNNDNNNNNNNNNNKNEKSWNEEYELQRRRGSNQFERIGKKKTESITSPLHRSNELSDKIQSAKTSVFGDICRKVGQNIQNLKKYLKNDERAFRQVQRILSKRHQSLHQILIKSNKKQQLFDNIFVIEQNITDILQATMNVKLKQKYIDYNVYIDSDQLRRELNIFYDDLEELCEHIMKDKVLKAFESVTNNDLRVQENIKKLQQAQKPIPLEIQNRKYLYMNQNILYMPEKLENYEKNLGEFSLISKEARIFQKEIEVNICKLKQIDREQRNPYRKPIIDTTQRQ